MKTILSTKKLKKSEIKKLSDVNFNVIEKKFIKTTTIDFHFKKLNEYVIFTSKNAIKSVLKSRIENQVRDKKIFCVGQKTKLFLEKHHYLVEESADYANDLGLIIKEKYKNHSFTFFSGNIRRNTLPDLLNENNIKWNETVVYETALNPKKIKKNIDGILFFSPSAVESYLIKNKIENQTCFCIGTTTAKALESKTKNIQIAAQPTVENVIDEVIKHYK
ncbi:uroporphyrinogen-III synthase [uncultured Flavobacterium sp.]|uniref:uroporphyrinogen-III synthase n=1 Tax=uncultured Flavobacterium sp. TaxID=165435 RepID=UPI0030EB31DA